MHTELNQNERQTQLYVKSMKLYADPVFPPVILEERSDFFLSASTMSFYIIRLVIMPFFFFLKDDFIPGPQITYRTYLSKLNIFAS